MSSSQGVRPAAVAGMFYPADPRRLRDDVDAMLDASGVTAPPGRLRSMVSPHAGYPYSGAVAAPGFNLLRDEGTRTVVMIGPSHVEGFDFTSVFSGEGYATPLGEVAVDTDLAGRIAAAHPTIRASARGHVMSGPHRGEHSLEVQLPFLQRSNPGAKIVPIVMGMQDWEHCAALGAALAECCGPDDVVLASSDLSHFYDYDHAVSLDDVFLDALARLDPALIHGAVRAGRCEACGAGPVVASIIATDAEKSRVFTLLSRANSGDVTGDRSNVVGYASGVVTTSGAATP